jgi:hypothetical protein
MNNWMIKGTALSLAACLGLAACGEDTNDTASSTQDGVVKQFDGKGDRWDWRNDPRRFRTELDYNFENLPGEGAAENVAWAASYWPYYEDGINYRWQGQDVLSPAEKYDVAFNGWEPKENFMELKPYNPSTCEWDDAYYDALGPAANWTHINKGNQMSRNGVDDDGDGLSDAEECGFGENKDRDGVETWWGICHAWAPAAILEREPLKAVEHNGITFETADLKALLMMQYDRTGAHMLGGRCNEQEVERDERGRITRSECRDLNAGTWHTIVTNFLGKHKRPFVIERVYDYEVWNQPLVGYEITSQKEISLSEANELLNVSMGEGTGVFVHGIEEGTLEARMVLELANTADFVTLDDDARLDRRAAENIVAARPFESLEKLDSVSYVAEDAITKMFEYASENGYADLVSEYLYNDDAVRFVEVRMTTDWITESEAMDTPTSDIIERWTRHDYYHYILELDAAGNIIGGEWVGSSIVKHPDFIWLPTAAYAGNPHIDTQTIRELIAKSREDVDQPTDPVAGELSFTSDERFEIPDNDPEGTSSVLLVEDEGTVASVTVDVDIRHTYRGDLVVELRHGGVTVAVFDGADVSNGWDDDVTLEAHALAGFEGSTAKGEWELRVVDTMGMDTGAIESWTLNLQLK